MQNVNVWALSTFIGYLGLIVGIGIFASRFSSQGIAEYFVGGKKMNRFVMALSAVVSGRSAWLLLGVTGMAYNQGLSAIWAVLGYILVEFFLFLHYAKRLRTFAEHHDIITLPDFFAERFNDQNHRLRILVVGIIFIFMAGYVSAQFVAGGKTFASSFGINQEYGLLLTAAIVLSYTMLGGFLAVSLTDMVQAFFMLFALIALPLIVVYDLGGWQVIIQILTTEKIGMLDPFALSMGAGLGLMGIGLGSPGNPHIITRYLSIAHPSQLKTAAFVGTTWNILMATGAILIGLVGRAWMPNILQIPDGDAENLFSFMASSYLHPALFGLVIASIFAAIMSTADSQLLVGASAIVRDIYEKVLNEKKAIEQKKLVFLSRLVVSLLVLFAIILAFIAEDIVFWLVLFAWAGLGAALGPTTILALFWKKTTRLGVISGMITGTLVTILWYLTPILKENLYELIPGFLLSSLTTIIVSLFTQPPKDVDKMMQEMLHTAEQDY